MIKATEKAEKMWTAEKKRPHVAFAQGTKQETEVQPSYSRERKEKNKRREKLESYYATLVKSPSHLRSTEGDWAVEMFVREHAREQQAHLSIIASDAVAAEEQKQTVEESGSHSFVHPVYHFIRSNRNEAMVDELLEAKIFPDRITLEEEFYILDNHSFNSPLWLTEKALSIMRKHAGMQNNDDEEKPAVIQKDDA